MGRSAVATRRGRSESERNLHLEANVGGRPTEDENQDFRRDVPEEPDWVWRADGC